MLLVAVALTVAIGVAHSYLGERYLLMRLFRQPLPPLFGGDEFTRKTLRFAWHITTLAWFGFAALLLLLYLDDWSRTNALAVIGGTFAVTGLTALVASRGKHLSWIVFGAIAIISFAAA